MHYRQEAVSDLPEHFRTACSRKPRSIELTTLNEQEVECPGCKLILDLRHERQAEKHINPARSE